MNHDEERCPNAAGSKFAKLRDHILSKSRAQTWELALLEWEPLGVVDGGDGCEHCGLATCPCGFHPISERCWISNGVTGAETYVGNVCIKRFMAGGSEALREWHHVHAWIKRAQKNPNAAPTGAVIRFAMSRKKPWLLPDTERFLLDTMRKRNLTPRQAAWRRTCVAQLLRRLVRAR